MQTRREFVPQREPEVPSDLLRAQSGNVTESNSAFHQQILNVTEAQGEPEMSQITSWIISGGKRQPL